MPSCTDETKRMSLRFSARNAPAFQFRLCRNGISGLPRRPASQVPVTTCWSGGSLASAFGRAAGIGRIGAAEFNGRRRAAALRVSRIGIHGRDRAPGNPDGGIESLIHIVAVERAGSGNRD